MSQPPASTLAPYAPDPVLAALPAVRALPEAVRQQLWRAVNALRPAGITVRQVKPQAYALCLYLTRPDLFATEDWGRVLLYYSKDLKWTKSVHQGPDCGLKQDALRCLDRCH